MDMLEGVGEWKQEKGRGRRVAWVAIIFLLICQPLSYSLSSLSFFWFCFGKLFSIGGVPLGATPLIPASLKVRVNASKNIHGTNLERYSCQACLQCFLRERTDVARREKGGWHCAKTNLMSSILLFISLSRKPENVLNQKSYFFSLIHVRVCKNAIPLISCSCILIRLNKHLKFSIFVSKFILLLG